MRSARSLPISRRSLSRVKSADRRTYLQRPDLGRKLADASRLALHRGTYDAVIVLADGLSADAVQSQGAALCRMLQQAADWRFAPPVIASQARVALGDEIAAALGAEMVILLIGERPGLSAADLLAPISLSRRSLAQRATRNAIASQTSDPAGGRLPMPPGASLRSLISPANCARPGRR